MLYIAMGIFYISPITCETIWTFLVHNFEHHTQWSFRALPQTEQQYLKIGFTSGLNNYFMQWRLSSPLALLTR